MFSIADMAVAGAVALLLFGPDQLPKVARRAGQLVRDVQNTSQSFIREMERAADAHDEHESRPPVDLAAAHPLPAAPAYHETPEPAPHELVAWEAALEPHAGVSEPAALSEPASRSEPAGIPEPAGITEHAGKSEPAGISEPAGESEPARIREEHLSSGKPAP